MKETSKRDHGNGCQKQYEKKPHEGQFPRVTEKREDAGKPVASLQLRFGEREKRRDVVQSVKHVFPHLGKGKTDVSLSLRRKGKAT